MFRNRRSSQKPGDDFIANFRQSFPEITAVPPAACSNPANPPIAAPAAHGPNIVRYVAPDSLNHTPSVSEQLDNQALSLKRLLSGARPFQALTSRALTPKSACRPHSLSHEDLKDFDPTPRAQHEQWRFTPSLLDPNSFAFNNFANQPLGFYTPTPGGTNAVYHNQAGDLHTPGMGIGVLGTPLSLSTSADGLQTNTMMDMTAFTNQLPHGHFQNYNPFANHPQNPSLQPEQTFAPSSFVHQDTGYETMEQDASPMDDGSHLGSMNSSLHQSPVVSFQQTQYQMAMAAALPPSAEKFRFHVTLHAPTAMIKHADEIPVTYLNKGQAYSISIVDTMPMLPLPQGSRYRTYIRISFEDEQQRQRPATCWQLWKEGRGTNEAHQRGGKLQAVEYVEANQSAETDDKRTTVELDTASFDGFSVNWSPGPNGSPECNLAVRFNFLSTDFSHSKGVKGIPVRLCAKTTTVVTGSPRSVPEFCEVAYCKVKLFRDHGAERKLSNDVAHVKKTIEKLKQQIAQAESGMKDFNKRKRTGSMTAKGQPGPRPVKVQKHKRTWSISSASSSGGRLPIEEDLHFKLQSMQDMFTSTRPVSVLYLRGSEQDDPDLHPVALPGEPLDLMKVDSRDSAVWMQRGSGQSSTATSLISPSPSSLSLQSQARAGSLPNPASHWPDFQSMGPADVLSANPQNLASPPDQPTKVPRNDKTGSLSSWIEALGVDPSYKPPAEQQVRPAACFYILRRDPSETEKQEYYRAVYIRQRTLKDFMEATAAKWNLDPTKIQRIVHVLERGLQVDIDDDVIRELAEGQDLAMEIHQVQTSRTVKNEWDMPVDIAVDGDQQDTVHTQGYELRFFF